MAERQRLRGILRSQDSRNFGRSYWITFRYATVSNLGYCGSLELDLSRSNSLSKDFRFGGYVRH
jgi:hypothetical protein